MHPRAFIKGIAIIFETLIIGVVLSPLASVAYFAWRANRPMNLPQFKGLSYYQFLDWRSMAYNDLAVKYQASHPDQKVKIGMCEGVDLVITTVIGIPQAGLYTLAGVIPSLRKGMSSRDRGFVPSNASWLRFLPSWWDTYEKFIWSTVAYSPETSVAYCRIQPDIPTPTELQAMMLQYNRDSTVSTAHSP